MRAQGLLLCETWKVVRISSCGVHLNAERENNARRRSMRSSRNTANPGAEDSRDRGVAVFHFCERVAVRSDVLVHRGSRPRCFFFVNA